MADREQLMEGARRLVSVNGRVRSHERVLVVTDPTMQRYADSVLEAVREAGAPVTLAVMPVNRADGNEPPAPIAGAMHEADVIFSPVSISITHTRAMRAALDGGARAILMTAYTDAIMTSPALLQTDFRAQEQTCRRLGRAFTEGSDVRLTPPPAGRICASRSRAGLPTYSRTFLSPASWRPCPTSKSTSCR